MLQRLKTYLGEPLSERNSKGEVRFCCAFCHKRGKDEDTKYHLYVNTSSGFYFCHRCEAKGNVSWILKRIEGDDPIPNDVGSKTLRLENLLKLTQPYRFSDEEIQAKPKCGLPSDYIPLMDHPYTRAAKYLDKRGISFDLAVQRGIGFGSDRLKGRIIFPVFAPKDKSKCIYWVARSYENDGHKDDCDCFLCTRRYVNAPYDKDGVIYGLEFVRGNKICITEGAISALNSGPNAVATLGKHITQEQLDVLCERFDEFQVALDPDAISKSIQTIKALIHCGKLVEFVYLPKDKDPADVGIEGMMELRRNAIPMNKYDANLLALCYI